MAGADVGGCMVLTGRFQPFHNDHLDLVLHALSLAAYVLIGVTNAERAQRVAHPSSGHRHLDSANPYEFEQRRQLVAASLAAQGIAAQRFGIEAFPLENPSAWAGRLPPDTRFLVRVFSDWEREKVRRFEAAGFETLVLPGDVSRRISGTAIRDAMRGGQSWSHWVPPGARELLAEWQGRAA